MTASLAELLREHDDIDRAAAALMMLVGDDRPAAEIGTVMLNALAATVSSHVAHEEGIVYPDVVPGGQSDLSQLAQEFAAEFVALRADWSSYVADWGTAAINRDWRGFQRATEAILPRMLDRIRRENDCLYPLALRHGAVTLR